MNCQECENLFDDLLDRRVKEPLKQRMELHLSRCGDCRAGFERRQQEYKYLFRALNHADGVKHLPVDFADRLVAECRRPQPWWHGFPVSKGVLIAASLVAVAGFVFAATVVVAGVLREDETAAAPEPSAMAETAWAADAAAPEGATASEVPTVPEIPQSTSSTPTKGTTMNKGIRAALTAAAATWAASVATANAEMNTSIPWTAGSGTAAEGVAFADGKVQVFCDASGNVTNLVAKPEAGETLTLTGDAMAFAAGAKITFAAPAEGAVAGGQLVFANDVTAAGALGLDRTDGAYVVWSGAAIDSKDYNRKIILSGVSSLMDWEIVKAFSYGDTYNTTAPAVTCRGPYRMISAGGVTTVNGKYEVRPFVLNRYNARNDYTWSIRINLFRWLSGDAIFARILTMVNMPQYWYEPEADVWSKYAPGSKWPARGYGGADGCVGVYGVPDASNTVAKAIDDGRVAWGGDAIALHVDRVELRRVGSASTVAFAGEVALSGAVDVAYGMKLAVLPKSGSTFAAPVFTGGGDVEYQRNATLATMNRMAYATGLTITNGATVTLTSNLGIATNALVDVYAGSTLSIRTSANNLSHGDPEMTIHADGNLFIDKNSHQQTFNNGRQIVVVDGGTVWTGHDTAYAAGKSWTASRTYLPFLTLLNGAHVKGPYANWGNGSGQRWSVVKTVDCATPVTIDSIGALAYKSPTFTLFVDDVTGDENADCVVGGEIPAFEANAANFRYYTTQKYGDGVLRINGSWALRGTTTVNAGGIVFGDNGGPFLTGADSQLRTSVAGKRDFVLKDGAKLGKTAGALTLDALTVTGGGVLELGPTATMAFADSGAKTWSGTLVVKGWRDGAVRFGTDATALTATQQAMIKTEDGRHLHLLSTGHLAPYSTRITIR